MTPRQRVAQNSKIARKGKSGSVSLPAGRKPPGRSGARSGKAKRASGKALTLMASAGEDGRYSPRPDPELYRPLKKPVTLRLDADVIAWFKKEGRRYQTRINQALRKVMERERKAAK